MNAYAPLPVQDGTCGDWVVRTAGDAMLLWRRGLVWMTNASSLVDEQAEFVRRSAGDVLIYGLGLGLALHYILPKPDVRRVVVVEKSREVIELVAPYYRDDRLEIIEADAFAYAPTAPRFDVIWCDIWPTRGPESEDSMRRLRALCVDNCGWLGVWSRPDL